MTPKAGDLCIFVHLTGIGAVTLSVNTICIFISVFYPLSIVFK